MRTPIVVPLEILKPYVAGKVFQYFSTFEKAPEVEGLNNYINSTMELVVPYLAGKEVLDARASDQQCAIAQSTYFDFKQMFETNFKVTTKAKSLEEVQTTLSGLTHKTRFITKILDTVATAQMYPEQIDEKDLSSKFRTAAQNVGILKLYIVLTKAADAFE